MNANIGDVITLESEMFLANSYDLAKIAISATYFGIRVSPNFLDGLFQEYGMALNPNQILITHDQSPKQKNGSEHNIKPICQDLKKEVNFIRL